MPSKAAFVRGLPSNTPAKEVIAKAKAAGLKLSPAYVYYLRSTGAMTRKKNGAALGRAEDVLRACAADLGLPLALEILRAERERVRRLLA